MNDLDRKIGGLVKEMINKSHFLHKDIAQKLGINKASLSQMLSGTAPLPFDRFVNIARLTKSTDSEIAPIKELYAEKLLSSGYNVSRQKCEDITQSHYTNIMSGGMQLSFGGENNGQIHNIDASGRKLSDSLAESCNINSAEEMHLLKLFRELNPIMRSEILIILSDFISFTDKQIKEKPLLSLDDMKNETQRLALHVLRSRNQKLENQLKEIIEKK